MLQVKQPIPNTFEVPSAQSGPYGDYWSEFREASNFVNLDDVLKTCRLGSYVGALTARVVCDGQLPDFELMPDMRTGKPQEATISNAVAAWDQAIGSFNAYHEGQPDLLRAAGLLLYANYSGDPEDFIMTGSDSEHVSEQFMTLVGKNSWELQKPTKDLLLAGQLIHKAAWVEQEPSARETLFVTAVLAYDRLYDDTTAEWTDRLLASQYRADIRFEWLDQDLRAAKLAGDNEWLQSLQELAIELLEEQLVDLQEIGRQVKLADARDALTGGDEGADWAGFMLESFAAIVTRGLMYVHSEPGAAIDYGLRRAFKHEDEPNTLKLRPYRSFDLIVQRRDTDGNFVHTTPIQLKLLSREEEEGDNAKKAAHGAKASRRNRVGEEDYGGIPVLYFKRCSTDKMAQAADDLLAAYQNRKLPASQGALRRAQRVLLKVFDEEFTDALIAV